MAHLPKDSPADIDITSPKTYIEIRRERRRVTWTQFHLSQEQDWPRWMTAHDSQTDEGDESATFLGPLVGVEGCEKVWLGRQVEDPTKAALIILWESGPALEQFEASPLRGELLRDLGCKDELDQDPPLISFQWNAGFWFGDDLFGRVTRTTIVVPFSGRPPREEWGRQIGEKFNGFMPAGCNDLRGSLPKPFTWQAMAWVDIDKQALALKDLVEQVQAQVQVQPIAVSGGGKRPDVGDQEKAVGYYFFRWNGNDASPVQEEITAQDPAAKKSWEEMMAKITPPVVFWERERWDVQLAPCYHVEIAEEDEEE